MKIGDIVRNESALNKLFEYGYLPVQQVFFLSLMLPRVAECLEAYNTARNNLLARHGESDDGVNFAFENEEAQKLFIEELHALEEEEVDIDFPEGKLTLYLDSVEQVNKGLPAEKRLGLTAREWGTIGKIIKVCETEG